MRQRQEITDIWAKLFPKFSGSSSTLQGRIREMMVHAILMGLVPPGAKVPPSRAMANALGISRNTVSLAFQMLVDKGFLISSSRSGLVVNGDILLGQASHSTPAAAVQTGLLHASSMLVKGSRFMRMERVVESVVAHFSNGEP